MSVRVSLVCACILATGVLGAGVVGAEELGPEQARAFVVGKLFSYTCFEGTAGMGRIFADGSVVGTIRMRGEGPPFVKLGRSVRYREEDVVRWMRSQLCTSTSD